MTTSSATRSFGRMPDGREVLEYTLDNGRGLVLRALNNYGLPHALRLTIGTEEANRLVLDGLRDFMALK